MRETKLHLVAVHYTEVQHIKYTFLMHRMYFPFKHSAGMNYKCQPSAWGKWWTCSTISAICKSTGYSQVSLNAQQPLHIQSIYFPLWSCFLPISLLVVKGPSHRGRGKSRSIWPHPFPPNENIPSGEILLERPLALFCFQNGSILLAWSTEQRRSFRAWKQ